MLCTKHQDWLTAEGKGSGAGRGGRG